MRCRARTLGVSCSPPGSAGSLPESDCHRTPRGERFELLKWLANLLGWRLPTGRHARKSPKGSASSSASTNQSAEKPRLVSKPSLPNLDHSSHRELKVTTAERELLDRVSARIERGEFDLPHLPATSMALLNLAGKSGVDVGRVVELISSDPTLASELLRTANSVLYATHVPAETLNQAVMRIGLRGLRSLVFTVSVKGTILRLGSLQNFSEEVWRQAYSVASISRRIAPLLGEDRDHAFLVGLLHDIGKIALLSMLSKEGDDSSSTTPATVGRIFYVHHERAGAMLAAKWRLSEELISVAGNHHQYLQNGEFGRSAALASLAHKLDLHLSFDDDEAFNALLSAEEFEYLGVAQGRRRAILDQARGSFDDNVSELSEAA